MERPCDGRWKRKRETGRSFGSSGVARVFGVREQGGKPPMVLHVAGRSIVDFGAPGALRNVGSPHGFRGFFMQSAADW